MRRLIAGMAFLAVLATSLTVSTTVPVNWSESTIRNLGVTTVIIKAKQGERGWMGTGTFIDKQGTVLTAAHVVDGELSELWVTMYDGSQYDCEVLAVDSRRDLAVIRVLESHQDFKYSKIQRSNHIYVGQPVLIIGHPYHMYWTVTTGVLSRFYVLIPYFTWRADTDAVVRPGNSGGPVYSKKGEIIGVVSAMNVDLRHQPTGTGVVVPIKEIHRFLRQNRAALSKPLPRPRLKIGR